jgi:hypothetical protein
MSLDQEHLQADALEVFPFFSLAVAGKDTVAVLIFGNVVFPIIFEVLCAAPSFSHVGKEAKCFLEVGPAVASVVHCLLRATWSEYDHRSC